MLHAIRVELLIRLVMPTLFQNSPHQPFQYWARFEEGLSGNPHAHGIAYADGDAEFKEVVDSEEEKQRLIEQGACADHTKTWSEAEKEVAAFFKDYESEWHPAKDAAGEPLYDCIIGNLLDPALAKPQTINLRETLI